jgi:putative phage-type endonuclease
MSVETPTGKWIGSFLAGSTEWHEARRNGVGGSEVAPIIGISPFESRFALWHRKKGTIPAIDLKDELEWGHRCEPMVAQKYADSHPEFKVVEVGTYCHVTRAYQIANPDRLLIGPSGAVKPLEIKYSLFGDGWGKEGTEEIPPYYRTQALHYIDTLGFSEIDVAVFIGGSATYREYTIRENLEEQAWLREQVKDFLDDLDTGTLPDIDGHDATYQAIKELHPEIDGETVEVPASIAFDYITTRQRAEEARTEAQRCTGQLADYIGNAKRATFGGKTIASRQARGDGTPYLVAARNLSAVLTPQGEAA